MSNYEVTKNSFLGQQAGRKANSREFCSAARRLKTREVEGLIS